MLMVRSQCRPARRFDPVSWPGQFTSGPVVSVEPVEFVLVSDQVPSIISSNSD